MALLTSYGQNSIKDKYNVVFRFEASGSEKSPCCVDEIWKHREHILVLLGIDFDNLTDVGLCFLQWSGSLVILA